MRLLFRFVALFLLLYGCSDAPGHESTDAKSQVNAFHAPGPTPVDSSELFLGKVRAQAKTSFLNTLPDTFSSVKALRKYLEADKYMHERTDAKFQDSPRCAEEEKNVVLTDLYIFGVKREDDNDFHLILCSSKKVDKDNVFFSAEISGLPDPSSPYYATLASVREKFKAYFGDAAKKETVFVASAKKPPIHLRSVTGSLFFDNHHYNGHSSVQGFQSCSAWEIHPVTAIEFE
jgi:hypothetical protein